MTLPERPQLKPAVTLIPVDDELLVRSLTRRLKLRGKTVGEWLPQLLPLIDGSRTVTDLQLALRERGPVLQALQLLDQAGLLADAAQPAEAQARIEEHRALFNFFDALNVDAVAALTTLAQAIVAVSCPPALAGRLAQVLSSYAVEHVELSPFDPEPTCSGVEARGDDSAEVQYTQALSAHLENASLLLVVLDRWSPTLLRAANRAALRAEIPLLPLAPLNEEEFLLGPMVVPGQTACWSCMELRMKSNWLSAEPWETAFERHLDSHPEAGRFIAASPAAFWDAATSLFTTEAVKWLTANQYFMQTLNQVVVFRPFRLALEAHPVLKLPRCPACAERRRRPATQLWMK